MNPSASSSHAKQSVVGQGIDLNSISVDDLARMAQSGDAEAFGELATRLRPRLLLILGKRLGGHDAEDVVQETLSKAWKKLYSYDGSRSITAWMYTIAIRQATDCLRGRKRRRQHTQKLPAKSSTTDNVQQTMMNKEATANVWFTAKRELSHPQYVALWLRYAEEFSIVEVAETMGKSQVATRVLLHRARAKLHSHLASEGRFDEA